MQTCGQCEYYLTKIDECPHPEKRALDRACDKLEYTNPRKRIDYLLAENNRQADFLSLAKEEMDALRAKIEQLQAENEKLKVYELLYNAHRAIDKAKTVDRLPEILLQFRKALQEKTND